MNLFSGPRGSEDMRSTAKQGRGRDGSSRRGKRPGRRHESHLGYYSEEEHLRHGGNYPYPYPRHLSLGDGSHRESKAGGLALNLDYERSKLDMVAKLLHNGLPTGSYKGVVHRYDDSFKGFDAVQYLVCNDVCRDAKDAENILRHLVYRKVLLRIDHTKPFLNSVVNNFSPSFAEWRVENQLLWWQQRRHRFKKVGLYVFNVISFSRVKIRVNVTGARHLRYVRHNVLTGHWTKQRIAPYINLTLDKQTASTLVNSKSEEEEVRWDEEFNFHTDRAFENAKTTLWLKVYDFRELGMSKPLGVLCLTLEEMMRNCCPNGVISGDNSPTIWKAWHDLVPPATSREPDEVRGAELELEITLLKNTVHDADLTVHRSCRKQEDTTADSSPNAQAKSNGNRAAAGGGGEGTEVGGEGVSPTKSVQSKPTLYVLVLESVFVEGVKDAISDQSTCWLEIVLRKPEGIISVTKSNRIFWPRANEPNELVSFGKICIKVKASDLDTSHLEVRLCRRLEGQIKYTFGKAKSKPLERLSRREDAEAAETAAPTPQETNDTLHPADQSVFLSNESALNENHPDFVRITMRRQAAFKRNVKIKVGSVATYMYLVPSAERGSGWNEGSLGIADQEDDVEIEDFLQVFQDKLVGSETAIEAPPPLDLVVVQHDVAIGIDRLSVMLLSENSRFIPMYNQATGNVDVTTGSWVTNMGFRTESLTGGQMRRVESAASGSVDDCKSETEDVVMPSRTITFKPSHVNGARSEEVQTITMMAPAGFVVHSETKTSGVPYGETFTTQVQFCVRALGDGKCKVRITGGLEWTGKPPLIRSVIIREVRKGQDKAFNTMMRLLTRVALGKRKSKGEEDTLEMDLAAEIQPNRAEQRQKWLVYASVALALIAVLCGLLFANIEKLQRMLGLPQPRV